MSSCHCQHLSGRTTEAWLNTRSTGAEVAGMAKKRFSASLLHLSHKLLPTTCM